MERLRGSFERIDRSFQTAGRIPAQPEIGADNRRLKRAGFNYGYTSAGAVQNFAEASRLRTAVGDSRPAYRYERDVEAFFRHSPAVVRD